MEVVIKTWSGGSSSMALQLQDTGVPGFIELVLPDDMVWRVSVHELDAALQAFLAVERRREAWSATRRMRKSEPCAQN